MSVAKPWPPAAYPWVGDSPGPPLAPGPRRRRLLLAWLGAPWSMAASAAALATRGDAVAWPGAVNLLDGRTWRPLAGQRKIVVFWSVTCPFCRRHNQHLQTLLATLKDKPLQLLTVANDRDAGNVRHHLTRERLGFDVTLDHAALAAALRPRPMVPMTITVDAQDRVEWVIPGEMTEPDVMALAHPRR